MTDEERRNRNPAVEHQKVDLAEFEAKHPVVLAGELEEYVVYVLQTPRTILTANYLGKRMGTNPVTLDAVMAHVFSLPRLSVRLFLCAKPDGSFADAEGNPVTVRRWMGEDA